MKKSTKTLRAKKRTMRIQMTIITATMLGAAIIGITAQNALGEIDASLDTKIETSRNHGQENRQIRNARATSSATITAYSEFDSCHYPRCTMASGKIAYVGAVACPRKIKLGTKVKIDGLGVFTCEDRTAKRYDGRYDIFTGYGKESHDKAIKFGKQIRTVEILK